VKKMIPEQANLSIRGPDNKVSRAPHHPIVRGLAYLCRYQSETGSLKGEYNGPLCLLPGYIFTHLATRTPIAPEEASAFTESIFWVQHADGGFGLHLEGPSNLFPTVLNYVALRLLGIDKADPRIVRALSWIRTHGGPLAVPSWGKYWLAMLRLYQWEGTNPVLPESWLLPRWLPVHPGRFWCHTRMFCLTLSYLYGRQWQVPEEPILAEIHQELYEQPFDAIDFRRYRNHIAPSDAYVPHSWLLKRLHALQLFVARLIPGKSRALALQTVLDLIRYEQRATQYSSINAVSKTFDVVALYAGKPRRYRHEAGACATQGKPL